MMKAWRFVCSIIDLRNRPDGSESTRRITYSCAIALIVFRRNASGPNMRREHFGAVEEKE